MWTFFVVLWALAVLSFINSVDNNLERILEELRSQGNDRRT